MVLWARTQDEPYTPYFVGSGVWYVHNSENKENDGEVFVNFQIAVSKFVLYEEIELK